MRTPKQDLWLKTAQKKLSLSFRNPKRLKAALSHPSYRNENLPEELEDFDRLEFFGDSILNFVICRRIYAAFPDADEGLLSRLRSILVSRKILSRIALGIKLQKNIRLGKSLLAHGEFSMPKILTDSLEALIAAFYFDRGFAQTENLILKLFKGYFDAKKLFRLDPNPKSTLQELVQRHWQKLPTYASEQTKDGSKTTASVHRLLKVSAIAKTRKESEEKAARLLIQKIRHELARRLKKKSSGRKLRRTF